MVFNWFYLNWDLAILCVDHPQNFMTELRDDDSEKKPPIKIQILPLK